MNILLYSEFPRYQESQLCKPPFIPPNWGPRCHRDPKFRAELLQSKLQLPKFKYETLEISEVFVNPLEMARAANNLVFGPSARGFETVR